MSAEHDRYRDHPCGWEPFDASGYMPSLGSISTIMHDDPPPVRQPIGFRGAAPGASLDDRGKPRVRVKALTRPI